MPPPAADAEPNADELRAQFWILVAVLNAALLATAVGVLLLAFRTRPTLGLALLAGGLAGLGLAFRRYRGVRAPR